MKSASKRATSDISITTQYTDRERTRLRYLDEIHEAIDQHSKQTIIRSVAFGGDLSPLTYHPKLSAIMADWTGHLPSGKKPNKQTVTIEVELDPVFEYFLDGVYCSCPLSSDHYLCEHTLIALRKLSAEFSNPKSKLLNELLGEQEPTWSAALKTLDKFLTVAPPLNVPPVIPVKPRLIWRLSVSVHGQLCIEPVEQTPGKRGGWNKGRSIEWDRVQSRTNLDLVPADFEALRVAKTNYCYYGPVTLQLGEILEKLVGQPHVYFNSTQMTVSRGHLGLKLVDKSENWELTPAIDGREIDAFEQVSLSGGDTVVVCSLLEEKIIVARGSRELQSMVREFLTAPPVIPPDVQAEFLKRLPALEAKIPIGLPASMMGEFVPANETLVLRVTPSSTNGAMVQFQTQPAPNGAFFTPGEGAQELSGQLDGKRIQVRRDHSGERLRADSLSKELFLHRFPSNEMYSWTMTSDDDVLDLLDALRSRPENDPRVLWPAENEARRMYVLGEVSPSALRVEVKDQHDWFGLSGSIDIGGQQFPLATLLAALKGGRRYLDLGKGQFAAISQEFRNRLASVTDMIHSNRGKLEFNSTAAPVLAELFKDEVTLKASKKWRESLKRLENATNLDPVVPSTLTAELRDYQVEGYQWLRRLAEWGVGGCLADDMGLGKTVQALALLLDRRDSGPALIVAPVSVGFNWMRETVKFAPTLRPILYRDTDRADFLSTLGPGDLLITSYYLLQQHAAELTGIKWGTLVLDEAQAVKNSQTKTAQVVREIQADWRLALTGTPVENHLGELWSLFRAIAPGLFGGWDRFREVFADPIEKGKDPARKQALSRVIRPFILRRTKSEVLTELPARTEIQLTAELSDAERRVYEDARLWAVTNLTSAIDEGEKDQRFQVLAALTKLRQLACHPRLVDKKWKLSSAKLDLFLETIDELREGRHRALVFSQFTQHLAIVREALDERKISYQYLDGSTPVKKRQEAVDAFQHGSGELFLISLKAGGTGLNLTGADYVVHLDPWWNPAVEDQATDRAHRIGQTRPVTVYRLVAKDTIEEQILKLHADKRGLVAGILEGTDAAGKLSTMELVDLIKLGGRQA